MHMFTSVHSSVTKLASKLAPRPTPSRANSTGLCNPKRHKGLVRRLQAIRAQHAVLSRMQGIRLSIVRKTKKLWTKPVLRHATPVVGVDEAPGIPHTVVIETLETRSGLVQPRTRVYTYWDVDYDHPDTIYGPYNAETQGELGRENEADATTPVISDDSSLDQYLNDVLEEIAEGESEWRDEYEWGDSDTEYEAVSGVVDNTGHVLSHLEVEDEVCGSSPSNHSPTGTAPNPISIFFCPPVSSSTLVPLTTSEEESAQNTPLYNPVLVHESESYEEALYSEFKKIIGET